MSLDINTQKYNSKAIYKRAEIANLDGWSVKKQGKTYTVYNKAFHHESKAWKLARGTLVVVASIFSLGIAYKCSKTLRKIWKEAKTGNEIKKIKVLNEKKVILASYADFFTGPEFREDNAEYLEPDTIAGYKTKIANKDNPALGYSGEYINLLMAIYFILDPANNHQEARTYISILGKSDVPAKDRIAFMRPIPTYNDSQLYIKELAPFLKKEIAQNLAGMRPAKIFIPIIFNSPNNTPHIVLLVIEPDQEDVTKANITLVNTWGKNITYKNEEDLIKDEAFKAYPNCSFAKNKIQTYQGPYCGIDVIENARLLANVDDVQAFIVEGKLPSRNKKEIVQYTHAHAEQMERMLKALGKW